MSNTPTLVERVSASYRELTTAATHLNAVSDELSKSVIQIDDALKKLNLGITVWVRVSGWNGDQYDPENFGSEDLGYAKVSGKWGVSLRKVEGNHNQPEQDDVESWLFNDAPRALRLSAIDLIPELLEKLSKEALKATKQVKAKLTDVQAVATALTPKRLAVQVSPINEDIHMAVQKITQDLNALNVQIPELEKQKAHIAALNEEPWAWKAALSSLGGSK